VFFSEWSVLGSRAERSKLRAHHGLCPNGFAASRERCAPPEFAALWDWAEKYGTVHQS
jgi:hypothetical protein